MKTFEELGVSEEIRHAIEELGFEQPMPVQEAVIPYLLGNGNDVIALAQTGTGKTAAYGIPVLQKVDPTKKETQALILSPTRELCLQIADDLSDFSKYIGGLHVAAVYGGASIEMQSRQLRKGAQIIVATPGRLIDLMKRGVAKLENVNNVVLDEADEMLNMGFTESINAIFEGIPSERNTLLFSATMSKEIEKIAKSYLNDYKEIVVGSRNEGAEKVNHIYYMVHAKDKYLALKRIVDYYPSIFAIIFCRTKVETQEIADKLIRDGYNAEALHGDLSQQQRDLTMQKFRQHNVQFLVATDVAARGLDVDDLTHVINYGLPDDIESYTHRSGRTGRAGKKGTSISIIHTRERYKVREIEKIIQKEFVDGTLPAAKEICSKQLFKVMDEILKVDVNEEEIEPFIKDINRHFEFIDKEDIIKKIISMTFNRFLEYYANAPEIEKPSGKRSDRERDRGSRNSRGERTRKTPRTPEAGYKRLFINLGKDDGFYPGEVMQFINKNVHGRQAVGHIDLLSKFSYIEVPEKDATKVMNALSGATYKGREVRCNDAEEGGHGRGGRSNGERRGRRSDNENGNRRSGGYRQERNSKPKRNTRSPKDDNENGDWRQFFQQNTKLKGEMPDFSEEGWARRKPKKK
ncbi:DEAD/DEAH box helicase [Prevotella disiens JCM 6334 = ATCC 29426]|uniref:Cold-shock DEAD box protein A n=2 Tax=Prevotella disiens TaxID=28130 RepID=A0A379DYJ1_9BACT|nr:DEAD/DEAH box helicase [Prevotella disiens]ERJ78515.1 DEAD/DEAH box helicase [Prevotella disiens JCM 6334 = ATCC 29426]SUB85141.1 Cold-shock DEAD box protein A [Prevotella disiens]